jgi:uncharacterized protein YdeI (BOF family)
MRAPFRPRDRTGSVKHCLCKATINALLVAVVLGLGTGCGQANGTVLGRAPAGSPTTVLAVRAGDTPRHITLCGRLVEKCPVAGCWFRLDDGTGVIKVDTKTAGFVVTEVPLETRLTVAGRIIADGDEQTIEATGLRF